MYKAKLSGSVIVNGKQYRFDTGSLVDAPKGTLDNLEFDWIEPKAIREPEAEKVIKPVIKKTRRKKNA